MSLYVERGKDTFQSFHVRAAERVAKLARQAGVDALVHISGIGSDTRSTSPYVRSRGEGEAAVLDAFPSAMVVRPAVMFGPGDAFVTPLLAMLRQMPIFPMFGAGATRLQPVYVERCRRGDHPDLAAAVGAPAVRAGWAEHLHI